MINTANITWSKIMQAETQKQINISGFECRSNQEDY